MKQTVLARWPHAEVHGRLAAVGADLEQRTDRAAIDAGGVQREPLVVGHEALGAAARAADE